ncbi:hypothetical protein GUITHDRAFT_131767 [Guillardia theta CCMP2712]|uniref:Protein kinase domain-containing protein n=3 Tax=Guillardia theta TaxID=55529 RepID=L1K2C9_GUITC|nr:hypothetical protein GUITHDRAFT_131767 [Guillardia theta CCMP2712]EKX54737.1 hypothetical protein GUITHDRAFT_131767 [Guillardia theta CCMP2712]|eukprot:XP_005841717.1 hypothetical protein GUITHDRAFT_131767 [Guillardia theta CCMP2712]
MANKRHCNQSHHIKIHSMSINHINHSRKEARHPALREAPRRTDCQCASNSIVIANPNDRVRGAIQSLFPEVHSFAMTSHEFFSALEDQRQEKESLQMRGWGGSFGLIWLDYCGTFSSIAGRKRQKDVLTIFKLGLICNDSHDGMLVLTLSLRGSPQNYQHDVVDSVVAFVCHAADANDVIASHVGTCSYKVSCQMYTLSFYARKKPLSAIQVDVPSEIEGSILAIRPEEDRQICFFPGSWKMLSTKDKLLPAGSAMLSTSSIVCKLVRKILKRSVNACIQESKLFYMTTNLCKSGDEYVRAIHLLVGDPVDVSLATRLLRSLPHDVEERVLLANKEFHETISQAMTEKGQGSCLGDNKFDFIWLGYESYKSFSARDLQHCYSWSDINDLFSHGLLRTCGGLECLVGICINHASNGECWSGSCVDWLVFGFQLVAAKHGFDARTLAVVQYCVECPRLSCVFLVQESKKLVTKSECAQNEMSKVGATEEVASRHLEQKSCESVSDYLRVVHECVDTINDVAVSGWKVQIGWDLDREKVPVRSSFKYKRISSQVSDLVADISGQRHLATPSGRNVSILLHEPGFSCILPVLLRMTARPMPIAPDGSTLVVDCVTVDKLQVWERLVIGWITAKRNTSAVYGLVMLAEASCKQAPILLEHRLREAATSAALDLQPYASESFSSESCNYHWASYQCSRTLNGSAEPDSILASCGAMSDTRCHDSPGVYFLDCTGYLPPSMTLLDVCLEDCEVELSSGGENKCLRDILNDLDGCAYWNATAQEHSAFDLSLCEDLLFQGTDWGRLFVEKHNVSSSILEQLVSVYMWVKSDIPSVMSSIFTLHASASSERLFLTGVRYLQLIVSSLKTFYDIFGDEIMYCGPCHADFADDLFTGGNLTCLRANDVRVVMPRVCSVGAVFTSDGPGAGCLHVNCEHVVGYRMSVLDLGAIFEDSILVHPRQVWRVLSQENKKDKEVRTTWQLLDVSGKEDFVQTLEAPLDLDDFTLTVKEDFLDPSHSIVEEQTLIRKVSFISKPDFLKCTGIVSLCPHENSLHSNLVRHARHLCSLSHQSLAPYLPASNSSVMLCSIKKPSGVSLHELIERKEIKTEESKIEISHQISDGLAYLHDQELSHGSLDAMNVILTSTSSVQLVDFGWFKEFSPVDICKRSLDSEHQIQRSLDLRNLGVVMLEMLSGTICGGKKPVSQENLRLLFDKNVDCKLGKLAHDCFYGIEGARPSARYAAWFLSHLNGETKDDSVCESSTNICIRHHATCVQFTLEIKELILKMEAADDEERILFTLQTIHGWFPSSSQNEYDNMQLHESCRCKVFKCFYRSAVSAGLMNWMLKVMERCNQSVSVFTECCACLKVLMRDETCRRCFQKVKGLSISAVSLSTLACEEEVISSACSLLAALQSHGGMRDDDDVEQEKDFDDGAIKILSTVLQNMKDSDRPQGQICSLRCLVDLSRDPWIANQLVKVSATDAAFEVMQSSCDQRVKLLACSLVCEVTSHVRLKDSDMREERMKTTVEVLRRACEETDCELARCCSLLIANILKSSSKSLGMLEKMGGIPVLIEGLDLFPHDRQVAENVCVCLHTLAHNNLKRNMLISDLHGVAKVIMCMQTHSSDAATMLAGCRLMGSLAMNNYKNKEEIARRRGVELILEAVTLSVCHEMLVEGFKSLLSICCNHLHNSETILNNIGRLVSAATNFKHEEALCSAFLELLAMANKSSKGSSSLESQDYIGELVWGFMMEFSGNRDIIKNGMSVVSAFPAPPLVHQQEEMRTRVVNIVVDCLVKMWELKNVRQACYHSLASFADVEIEEELDVLPAFQLVLTSVREEIGNERSNILRCKTLLFLTRLLPLYAMDDFNQDIMETFSECLQTYQGDISTIVVLLDCCIRFICKVKYSQDLNRHIKEIVKLTRQHLSDSPTLQSRLCELFQHVSKAEAVDEECDSAMSEVIEGLSSPNQSKILNLIASSPDKFSSKTLQRAVSFIYHHISSEDNSEERVCQCIDDLRRIFQTVKADKSYTFKTSTSFMSSLVHVLKSKTVSVENRILTSHMIMLLVQDQSENCMLFAEQDGITAVLTMLDEVEDETSENVSLTANVCAILTCLADVSLKLRVWITNEDAVRRLLRLVSQPQDRLEIVCRVVASLNKLCENNLQGIEQLASQDGAGIFMNLLQQQKSNAAIVEASLQILDKLFSKSYKDRTNKTISHVFAAMWLHENSEEIQYHGCTILFHIVQSKVIKDLSQQLPNLVSVIKSSLLYHFTAKNSRSAAQLLHELYKQLPSSSTLVLDERLAKQVISALEAFGSDHEVVDVVVKLLHRSLLCYRDSPISREAVKQSVITTLSNMMSLHQDNEDLQTTFLRLFHAVLLDNKCIISDDTMKDLALGILHSLELFEAPTLRIYASRSLSSILSRNESMQAMARETNFISVITSLLEDSDEEHLVLESVLMMIDSFSRGNAANANSLYSAGVSKTIFNVLLTNQDPMVREKASSTLSTLAASHDDRSKDNFTDDDLLAIKSFFDDTMDAVISEPTIMSTCRIISSYGLHQTENFCNVLIHPIFKQIVADYLQPQRRQRGLLLLWGIFSEIDCIRRIEEETIAELVDVLYRIVKDREASSKDVQISLAILADICDKSSSSSQCFAAQDGIQIFLDLVESSQDPSVVACALKLLHAVLSRAGDEFVRWDIFIHFFSSLRDSMKSEDVLEQLLRNLHLALSKDNTLLERFTDQHGLDLLVEMMKTHSTSFKILQLCFIILSMFCDAKFKQKMEGLDVFILTLQVMRVHDKEVIIQTHCCKLVAWYAWMFPSSRNLVGEREGVERIVCAMLEFVDDNKLQLAACDALAYLTKEQHKNGVTLASKGGMELVLAVMRAFLNNSTILEVACMILSNIAQIAFKYCTSIVELGAVELLLEAMQGHPESSRLQERACFVLWSLARSAALKRSMDSRVIISRITFALDNHHTVPTVLEYACSALAVFIDQEGMLSAFQNDAATHLYLAIQHSMAVAQAQRAAWRLVHLLAVKYGDSEFLMLKSRAIPLALDVLLVNMETLQVVQDCLKALLPLAQKVTWHAEDESLKQDVIRVVNQVLARYGKQDESVRRTSRRILKELDRSTRACLGCFG